MQELGHCPTSPFGSRSLSITTVAMQRHVRSCEEGTPVQKWRIFRMICEAAPVLRLSDRTLAVLNALLTFHPDGVLTAGAADLIVYPSNRQLALRAHGMAPSTLRRHLAALVTSGLVLRRDSPNGKRFARRSAAGELEQRFGFDLGPLIARAGEFERLATDVRERRRNAERLRRDVTLLRRDIAKMIVAGADAGIAADWAGLHETFRGVVARSGRQPTVEVMTMIVADLKDLAGQILALLETEVSTQAGKDAPMGDRVGEVAICVPEEVTPASTRHDLSPDAGQGASRPGERTVPLRMVLEVCPDIIDYARHGIRSPRDLIATAEILRPMLGISPSAWDEARKAMGPDQASVVLAAVLQRGAAIKSPGAYVRALARRAAAGRFSVWPMLMALSKSDRPKSAECPHPISNKIGWRPRPLKTWPGPP